MKFHYNDKTVSNELYNTIIKKNNNCIRDVRKNFTRILVDNDKMYFVKTVNVNIMRYQNDSGKDNEIKPTIHFLNSIERYPHYQCLFPKVHIISQSGPYSYYIMSDIRNGDLADMLPLLNKRWVCTFLLQSLIGIYILNHKIKLFHNDLYYIDKIRNVMVHKSKKDDAMKPLNIKLGNSDLFVLSKQFCVKIIDFGRASHVQEFRTTEYHKKYFNHIKYISEPLLFCLFLFKTIGVDQYSMLNQISNDLHEKVETLREFDEKLITFIYDKYSKYLMQ